jgi:hypothetical protein
MSTVVPLKDGNQWHVGILIGGRDTNYTEGGVTYLADAAAALSAQKASMDRLQPIVAKAGVDVFLTIRSLYDKENDRMRALKMRKPGDPHPHVSKNVVSRYLTTISECMGRSIGLEGRKVAGARA